jgi:dTDP-4-dehydrorhamnose reductase
MTTGDRQHLRRLLVTGGAGLLGRHVVAAAEVAGWEVAAPTSGVLDLRRADAVQRALAEWRPSAVIHTAYRRDDRASIVAATRHVTAASAATGARLVHVSTDVVFPGRPAPFVEADEPAPVHDYGRAKAEAERIASELGGEAVIVRTSLILAADGLSQHERAVADAISGAAPITFFTDEVRCPVLVGDLARALVALAGEPTLAGPLHLGGPRPLSRAELALMIARRHGWDAGRLRFEPLGEHRPDRPAHVVLDSTRAASLGLQPGGPDNW